MSSLTIEKQNDWLSEDNKKIILCDIVYHDGISKKVAYFSNDSYIMQFTDSFVDLLGNTVSNISYIDNLVNIPNIISKIDTDINIGALEFLNAEGLYDQFITYAWEGHPLRIYIGDPSWPKDKFILILEAISSNISSPRPNIMSLSIRDKKEVFNVKAQTTLIDETYVRSLYSDHLTTYGISAFQLPVSNLKSQSVDIQINLAAADEFTNIPALDIAQAMALAIDALPEFTATPIDGSSTTITITNAMNGLVENAHDGNLDPNVTTFDTGFTVVNTPGSGGTQHITTITTNAASEIDLNTKYIHIHTIYKNFYIWFNVNSKGINPNLIEEVLINFDPDPVSVIVPDTILNNPVPICLGKCFNVEPVLIDTANHIYQVHEGPIQNIIEVRANGVPLNGPLTATPQYEVNLNIGCIRLLVHQNNTQITCDVLGAPSRGTGFNSNFNLQINSAAHLVEWLALEKTTLTSADICPTSFNDTVFDNIAPLGLYIKEEVDVATLIPEIMNTVGGFARFDRICTLQLVKIEDPTNLTPDLYITEDTILEKGISLGTTEAPRKSITLGHTKNWTVQEKGSLAGLITDLAGDFLDKLDVYSNEFSKVIGVNNIIDEFPLAQVTDLIPSLFANKSDATAEVNRRTSLRSTKRYVYKLSTTAAPFTLSIGDVVNVKHRRFGFVQSKNCLVIGMEEQPTKQRVNLEVWL